MVVGVIIKIPFNETKSNSKGFKMISFSTQFIQDIVSDSTLTFNQEGHQLFLGILLFVIGVLILSYVVLAQYVAQVYNKHFGGTRLSRQSTNSPSYNKLDPPQVRSWGHLKPNVAKKSRKGDIPPPSNKQNHKKKKVQRRHLN